jgi:ATP-dependent DNA helicase RecG
MAQLLQRTRPEADEALDTAAECRVGAAPLLTRFKDVWVLSKAAVSVVESAASAQARRSRGILPYRRPDDPLGVVRFWLGSHRRITSGDYAALTGLTQAGARYHLDRLVNDDLLERGDGMGRNAHFVAGRRLDVSG